MRGSAVRTPDTVCPPPGKATRQSCWCSESAGRAGMGAQPLSRLWPCGRSSGPSPAGCRGRRAEHSTRPPEPERCGAGATPEAQSGRQRCGEGWTQAYPGPLPRGGPHTTVVPRPPSASSGQTRIYTDSYMFISGCTKKSNQDIRLMISWLFSLKTRQRSV